MITYLYWLAVVATAGLALYIAGAKLKNWKFASIAAISL